MVNERIKTMTFFVGIRSDLIFNLFAVSSDREKDVILFLEIDNLAFVISAMTSPCLRCV